MRQEAGSWRPGSDLPALRRNVMLGFVKRLITIFAGSSQPMEAARSPKWNKTRDAFIAKNPSCSACGQKTELEVHHCLPYHLRPDLELLESNLIVLCHDCHYYFGHLKNWKSYNDFVRQDASAFKAKVASRP